MNLWKKRRADHWFTDFSALQDQSDLFSRHADYGRWQLADYKTNDGLAGHMILANPLAGAHPIRVALPRVAKKTRYSVSIGIAENYSDRLLIKLARDRTYEKLTHGDVATMKFNWLQDCWWKDIDLTPAPGSADELILAQDNAQQKRVAVAYVRLAPAPPASAPEVPFITTMDGLLGNNGPIDLDEMIGEELLFDGTHVSALAHGFDLAGLAEYRTELGPEHEFDPELQLSRANPWTEHFTWMVQQFKKYNDAGRDNLAESIAAAHSIGRPIYDYHRMGITRLYAPMRVHENPMFDAHPEWRCVDFDGTPVSRLSVAFPQVRKCFIDGFRETVSRGCDGVCLVFCRGWPLVLYEKPIAAEYKRRTGKPMAKAKPFDRELTKIRCEVVTDFVREIRAAITDAAGGREVKILTLPLATPGDNLKAGFDCRAWVTQGLVEVLCPYPYSYGCDMREIDVPAWRKIVAGTSAQLLPILNRAGARSGAEQLAKAERWLKEGVDGFSFWDLDGFMIYPEYRLLAYHLASREGRRHLKRAFKDFPVRHRLDVIDGLAVDRFHPGWNV